MEIVKGWYIKDDGDHSSYMSGLAIPVDADNVTRNLNFVDCDFHPASYSVFENCLINGKPIPDGKRCLWNLNRLMRQGLEF